MNESGIGTVLGKEYDRIAGTIGREDAFYERILALHSTYYGKILDIACGPGLLLKKLSDAAPRAQLFGIDISPKLCEIAKERNPEAEIQVGDAESLPYADETFDFVFMTETLAHLPRPSKALSEAHRVLKPTGIFILTVPNRDWLRYEFYERMRKEKFPTGTHYFRFKEIESLLRGSGFRITRYMGSDNLYYYEPYHRYEQMLAFFLPFLHKRMKRLLFKCQKDVQTPMLGRQ
ncbi:MAG TPA: class I SAM-dependent methyltransferase [Candidatus Paceibacterota bacterium]|nr:class I SAM-dependent methyltransferase [Candidatus Paceibacterota bacterium]